MRFSIRVFAHRRLATGERLTATDRLPLNRSGLLKTWKPQPLGVDGLLVCDETDVEVGVIVPAALRSTTNPRFVAGLVSCGPHPHHLAASAPRKV